MIPCRYLPGDRLRTLVPESLRPAIDPAARYPAPWHEGERTQVMVPLLSGGCVFVVLGDEEWAGLAVRPYVVE